MKKKLALFISTILIFSLLVGGCSKSTKSELIESFRKTDTINSQETLIEWELSTKLGKLKDNIGGFILDQITSGRTMELRSKEDINKQEFVSTLSTSFMGINLDTEIIRYKDIRAIKSPLLKNFLEIGDRYLISTSRDKAGASQDIQNMLNMDYLSIFKELNKVSLESLKTNLNDDKIQVSENVSLETPDGSIEGKEYRILISNEEIKPMAKDLTINILKNRSLREIILGFVKSNESIVKDKIGKVDLNKNPKETIDKIFEILDIKGDIQLKYLVDEDRYIRNSSTEISLTITNKETQESENILLNANSTKWNINQPLDINIPDFTEKNSIKMEEIDQDSPFIRNFR